MVTPVLFRAKAVLPDSSAVSRLPKCRIGSGYALLLSYLGLIHQILNGGAQQEAISGNGEPRVIQPGVRSR
jgi:hypothetical protein